MSYNSVYGESSIYPFIKSILAPVIRPALLKSIPQIIYNFFFRQHLAALFPGKIPVTKVDHPLDEKIPFVPGWVTIYIDFVHFWIRMVGFFLRRYGRRVYIQLRDFVFSMGRLYAFAAEAYMKNLSTTKRPFYIGRPRFLVIHLLDPHLMCVPSLHVMVVIYAYKMFIEISRQMGDGDKWKEEALEMKQGALAISQAILFVKQHSVNCIPAALYALGCFCPEHFSPEEAEAFTNELFSPPPKTKAPKGRRVHPSAAPRTVISGEDQKEIKTHILILYRRFLEESKTAKNWYDPIIKFLREMN